MSHFWPENMKKPYSVTFEIEKPEGVDRKRLFVEIENRLTGTIYKLEGNENCGEISPPTFPGLPISIPGLSTDVIKYGYEIDEQCIRVTIHKKMGPIIGIVEQYALDIDKQLISQIFLDAIMMEEDRRVDCENPEPNSRKT